MTKSPMSSYWTAPSVGSRSAEAPLSVRGSSVPAPPRIPARSRAQPAAGPQGAAHHQRRKVGVANKVETADVSAAAATVVFVFAPMPPKETLLRVGCGAQQVLISRRVSAMRQTQRPAQESRQAAAAVAAPPRIAAHSWRQAAAAVQGKETPSHQKQVGTANRTTAADATAAAEWLFSPPPMPSYHMPPSAGRNSREAAANTSAAADASAAADSHFSPPPMPS